MLDAKRAARDRGEPVSAADHALVDYYPSLLRVVIDARQADHLPLLIAAIGTGNMVIDAIAQRGETAWPALRTLLAEPGTSDSDLSSAFRVVSRLLAQNALSTTSARQAISAAKARLTGTQSEVVVAGAVRVAVAARDQDALRQIRLIRAFGAGANNLTLQHPENSEWLNRQIDRLIGGTKKGGIEVR